jgi:methionine synthase II (cobalamin-independent)
VFGTLLGGLPWPDGVDVGDSIAAVWAAVRAQEAAGLEPITDGRLGVGSGLEAWRRAAALTERAVKQTLPGPYSGTRGTTGSAKARERAALAAAEGLRAEVEALAAAGCPLVEIEETEAHRIGDDSAERRLFAAAHRRLAEGITGTHLSLSIVGGSAWGAGAATILDAPYASLAVDLIAGPENWRLVAVTPGERGIVAGALTAELGGDDGREILLYAANYAASTEGRGQARVGLGTAGGLAHLTCAAALEKLAKLGDAVRVATLSPAEAAASLDPRAVNARSAALGRAVPARPRRAR